MGKLIGFVWCLPV